MTSTRQEDFDPKSEQFNFREKEIAILSAHIIHLVKDLGHDIEINIAALRTAATTLESAIAVAQVIAMMNNTLVKR